MNFIKLMTAFTLLATSVSFAKVIQNWVLEVGVPQENVDLKHINYHEWRVDITEAGNYRLSLTGGEGADMEAEVWYWGDEDVDMDIIPCDKHDDDTPEVCEFKMALGHYEIMVDQWTDLNTHYDILLEKIE